MTRRSRKSSDYQELRNRAVGNRATQQENVIPMINIIFLLLLPVALATNVDPPPCNEYKDSKCKYFEVSRIHL